MRGIKVTPEDERFSQAIRQRDGWRCQKCNEVYIPPTRALHAAHMFSRACKVCTAKRKRGAGVRQHACTRLDPDNVMALCFGCHQYVDSHPEEKRKLWISRLGIDRYEALAARAHGKRDRTEVS